MKPIRVGIVGFDQMTALDLVGPMDAFAQADTPKSPYEIFVIGITERPFTAHSGLIVKPHYSLKTAPAMDTLMIAGGKGSRIPETNRIISDWLRVQAPKCRRVASICTGAYFLGPTGLLDGKTVTTHWRHAQDFAQRFPKIDVDTDAIYLKSGKYYTSAGITAGIDLTLALIEEDYGSDVALRCARDMVVYLKRPGGQRQFSEPLRLQSDSIDEFSGLLAWIAGNLTADLSVDTMAARMSLSRRHFTRLFKNAFGSSLAEVVEGLRLDQARTLLSDPHATVSAVASAVGFSNSDSFRRAFVRRFGIAPSSYRQPFAAA